MIILETNMGEIHITVDAEKAPITAKNFTDYVEEGFFDGTIFHRVIPNFMIQGGGMTEDMQQKTTKATIENEAKNGLKNVKYSVEWLEQWHHILQAHSSLLIPMIINF